MKKGAAHIKLESLNDIHKRFRNYLRNFKQCMQQLPEKLGDCQSIRPSIKLTTLFYRKNLMTDYQELQYLQLKNFIDETLGIGERLLEDLPGEDDDLLVAIEKLFTLCDSSQSSLAYEYFARLVCISLLNEKIATLFQSLQYYRRLFLTNDGYAKLTNNTALAASRSVLVGLYLNAAIQGLIQSCPESDQARLQEWVGASCPETNRVSDAQLLIKKLVLMQARLNIVSETANQLVGLAEAPNDTDISNELTAWLKSWSKGDANICDVYDRVFQHLLTIDRAQDDVVEVAIANTSNY